MKNRIDMLLLSFLILPALFAGTAENKWGVSASIAPWIDNREFTVSRYVTKSWTILLWGDF
ncbi:hypothetical protein JXJ21_24560 [candidate division KSB1 bacterium]|nr:hypothetical protein [candidate division KSB1 bacterium]